MTDYSSLEMRVAVPGELNIVLDLMGEAASWLKSIGVDQWQGPFRVERIADGIAAGRVWFAEGKRGVDREVVGTITVDEFADMDFWTEADDLDSALYVHRMAVRREDAGRGIGAFMLEWAAKLGRDHGKSRLRLDANRDNTSLQRYYQRLGWQHVRTVYRSWRPSGALFELPLGPRGS
ncbi:Acetyltransferase (GNAT) family protein [Actinokineospora alba]|uniref:Acetyltransferase (GNAT) family protein n=1 Tax=Actinokineospora alba TaxID=504798 RepID=A0A1H0VAF4_9PSEU|nr:GNAT family N-acetyltransferase [Actinokineospora alba]TDP65572.1 acetyltransferase (GNAT) family protein [Actinokineospora alba]SDH65759.1 Acetyltransferase (GNAT) family protein [Actinokineospora alba]SDP75215.1 Acetyltransferase (GNAT) family protein [Actinokineospora alba]